MRLSEFSIQDIAALGDRLQKTLKPWTQDENRTYKRYNSLGNEVATIFYSSGDEYMTDFASGPLEEMKKLVDDNLRSRGFEFLREMEK